MHTSWHTGRPNMEAGLGQIVHDEMEPFGDLRVRFQASELTFSAAVSTTRPDTYSFHA